MSEPAFTYSCGRRIKFTDADFAEMRRQYEAGDGMDMIGKRFKCAGGTIRYWLDKMRVCIRPVNGPHRKKRGVFHLPAPTPAQRERAARNGVLSQAGNAAAQFYQPSIISFMPESPALEMEWRHVLADTQAERGRQWRAIGWGQQQ